MTQHVFTHKERELICWALGAAKALALLNQAPYTVQSIADVYQKILTQTAEGIERNDAPPMSERQEIAAFLRSQKTDIPADRALAAAADLIEFGGFKMNAQVERDREAQRREDFGPNGDATTPGFMR